MKILIHNALWQGYDVDILIQDQKIKALRPDIKDPDAKIINAHHYQILPGLCDPHVHFRDPGLTQKETIHTGTEAAAHGGFTSVCAMPNVKPVIDTPERFKAMKARNQKESVIKTYQYAALSKGLTKHQITDMQDLSNLGAIAFTNDGVGVQSSKTMYQAMIRAKKADRPLVAHVEDDSLFDNGVMNQDQSADKLHLPGMNSLSESSQLARDLMLAYKTKVHYHVAHVSTKESVELIRIAKEHGVNVTAEVSPHHLLLDDSMIIKDDPMMKMNPPLRTPSDRKALIGGLLDGTIDMIATDHAPHTREDKTGSMLNTKFGIVGLETSFSLIYTHLIKSGIADVSDLVRWMVKNPSDTFNLHSGQLKVNDPADLTIMDISNPYRIDSNDFLSKGKNSPFIGEKVFGKTMLTMVDGQIVYRRDRF